VSEKDGSVSEKDGSVSEKDRGVHQNCILAQQSSRPSFLSTETFHQNVEDMPNTKGVSMGCCVLRRGVQCEGETAGAENTPHTPHAAPTTDRANLPPHTEYCAM
jgi:hypothetical protein